MNSLKQTAAKTLAFLFLLLGASLTAAAADLTVRVAGQAGGKVYFALYDREGAWAAMQNARQTGRDTYADGYTTVFKDLPPGRYALALFVDENDNANLDRNPMGIPLEPYGFSRDAIGKMGPPTFNDAAIELTDDAAITIHLR